MENILITICARGGSKGIPGKNIKILNNHPLIYYSLKVAEEFAAKTGNTSIVLSTDSDDIKNVVQEISKEIDAEYDRPAQLANDSAGKLDAITDVKNYMENKRDLKYDYIIDLDVTSPLRNIFDLEKSLEILKNNQEAYNIFSVSPANRNPYFNMVEEKENGFFTLCKTGKFLTRQSAPKVYDMNASFYIYKSSFFQNEIKSAISDKSLVYEVPHLCFDLDHPIDFEIMSFLMENDKLDFDLISK